MKYIITEAQKQKLIENGVLVQTANMTPQGSTVTPLDMDKGYADKTQNPNMRKVNSFNNDRGASYDYYVGEENGKPFYNIVPGGQKPPQGGYFNKNYILKTKQLPDMFSENKSKKYVFSESQIKMLIERGVLVKTN